MIRPQFEFQSHMWLLKCSYPEINPEGFFSVCLFSVYHSRFFHWLGDVTGEGLQFFTNRHSWPSSSEGSLTCHTYCDTGQPFIGVISEDPCCRAVGSGAVTTCFDDLGLSRQGIELRYPACEASTLLLSHRGVFFLSLWVLLAHTSSLIRVVLNKYGTKSNGASIGNYNGLRRCIHRCWIGVTLSSWNDLLVPDSSLNRVLFQWFCFVAKFSMNYH